MSSEIRLDEPEFCRRNEHLTNFTELGLTKLTASALEDLAYTSPTEIQSKAIPHILSGRDLMASAQTGSGKTAAYALPVIERLQDRSSKPRALVLAPTRELALQVEDHFKSLGKYSRLRTVTLYGGSSYNNQARILQRGVDVIIATPGRLLDCLDRRSVDLSAINIVILDEADRLMDMGFMPQIRRVIASLPRARQTLMFSATFDAMVSRLAADYLVNPVSIRVNTRQVEPKDIDQRMYHVNEFGKDDLLLKLIKEHEMSSVLIFTRTRRKATWVKSRLRAANVQAEEIHSDISQSERERTLTRYREGAFPVLVATDVAARGLDIPSITHVINYDLPTSPEDYVHRIGRTGRAGRAGVAFSFVAEGEKFMVRDIEKVIGRVVDPLSQKRTALPPRRFRPSRRSR
jgi:ATP-dependent RNA helicase RhlE